MRKPWTAQFVTRLAALARNAGVFLVAGMTERVDGDDRAYNTAVVLSPSDGLIRRYYAKTHLYDAFGFRESDTIRPGALEGAVTFEVEDVIVGVLTCYDLRFPEAARQHADAGVELYSTRPRGCRGHARRITGARYCAPAPSRTHCSSQDVSSRRRRSESGAA